MSFCVCGSNLNKQLTNLLNIFQGHVANRRAQTSHLPLRKNTTQTLASPKRSDPPIQRPLASHSAARGQPPAEPSLFPWKPRRKRTRTTSTRTRTGPLTALRLPSKSSAAIGCSPSSFRRPLIICFAFRLQAQSGPGQRSGHLGQGDP